MIHLPMCPECGGKRQKIILTREIQNITYRAPAEECSTCGEIFTDYRMALAELRAMRANQSIVWDEHLQRQLERLEKKERLENQ
jgi:transcriptional regulator NrdR family protein